MSRFAGANPKRSDEWLTDPRTHAAVGGWEAFDLDPAAMVDQPWPTARRHYTIRDNGLILRWDGDVWLNPPYTVGLLGRYLARMAEHGRGIALIFARTDTAAFHSFVWQAATALLFLRGRQQFCLPDGQPARRRANGAPADAGAPSVLCAYGGRHAEVLAGCGLEGELVPLRFTRGVLVAALDRTWGAIILDFVREQRGPVSLADIYRFAASQPRARRNKHVDAKVRQVLQEGPFRRVGHRQWSAA